MEIRKRPISGYFVNHYLVSISLICRNDFIEFNCVNISERFYFNKFLYSIEFFVNFVKLLLLNSAYITLMRRCLSVVFLRNNMCNSDAILEDIPFPRRRFKVLPAQPSKTTLAILKL